MAWGPFFILFFFPFHFSGVVYWPFLFFIFLSVLQVQVGYIRLAGRGLLLHIHAYICRHHVFTNWLAGKAGSICCEWFFFLAFLLFDFDVDFD